MSLQQADVSHYPEVPSSRVRNRDAVDQATNWMDRAASLLDDTEMSAELCRERLRSVPALRSAGEATLRFLEREACQSDVPLLDNLRQAVHDLDARELELRHRLALLAPGDEEAGVDLVRDRASQAGAGAAKGGSSFLDYPAVLQLTTSPANWKAALYMGLFSLTWLLVTSVTALLMLGGFMHTLGFLALGFLVLYAVIFGVGAVWATSAVRAATHEQVLLSGRELTVSRKLGPLERRKRFEVSPTSRAALGWPTSGRSGAAAPQHVVIRDGAESEILVAVGRAQSEMESLVEQLNGYFQTLR